MMFWLRQLPRLPILLVAALCLLTAATGSACCTWCLDGSGKARTVAADNGSCAYKDQSGLTSKARAVADLCGQDGNGASRCLYVSSETHWRAPGNRTAGAKIAFPPLSTHLDRAVVAAPDCRTFQPNLYLPSPRTPDLILLQRTTILRV